MAGILATQFRDRVSKVKDHRMKDEGSPNVSYPTGFLVFDFMNGSIVHVRSAERSRDYYSVGIQDGCLVMLIGRSGCGKTTFGLQAAANIVRPFPNALIVHDDIEGGITDERKQALMDFSDEEFRNRYIYRNSGITAENFYERMKMLHDMKLENYDDYVYDTGLFDRNGERIFKLVPTVVLLDSLALLMPEKFSEEDEISGSMSASAVAKTNSGLFKRCINLMKAANIILIAINHINKKIDIGPVKSKSQLSYLKQDETLPGGNTAIYLTNILLRFDDNEKLKAEKGGLGIDGSMVDITLVKSRNNRAGQSCTLVFESSRGFDPELSLLVMLKKAGKIGGAGAYLYLNGYNDMKFTQKDFKNKLQTDPDFMVAFQTVCIMELKAALDAFDQVENTKAYSFSLAQSMLDQINGMAA